MTARPTLKAPALPARYEIRRRRVGPRPSRRPRRRPRPRSVPGDTSSFRRRLHTSDRVLHRAIAAARPGDTTTPSRCTTVARCGRGRPEGAIPVLEQRPAGRWRTDPGSGRSGTRGAASTSGCARTCTLWIVSRLRAPQRRSAATALVESLGDGCCSVAPHVQDPTWPTSRIAHDRYRGHAVEDRASCWAPPPTGSRWLG